MSRRPDTLGVHLIIVSVVCLLIYAAAIEMKDPGLDVACGNPMSDSFLASTGIKPARLKLIRQLRFPSVDPGSIRVDHQPARPTGPLQIVLDRLKLPSNNADEHMAILRLFRQVMVLLGIADRGMPFHSRPPALVPQRVREEDLWGNTPEDLDACRSVFRTLRNEGIFAPPSLKGSLIVPGNIGGLHWGGVAYDPLRKLLIAPVNRLPAIIRLIPRDQFDAAKKAHPERETTEQDGTPFSMSRQFFMSPSGTPCIAPPWGELVAVNADNGEIAWRNAIGELPAPGSSRLIQGSPNLGGPITTDNGLVFLGATLDGYFRAFETDGGREVWKAKLPTSARATPLLFKLPSGRQMIAIAAGGHDSPFSKLDTKLVVFAIPDR